MFYPLFSLYIAFFRGKLGLMGTDRGLVAVLSAHTDGATPPNA